MPPPDHGVICSRVEDTHWDLAPPGTTEDVCSKCQHKVSIAPAMRKAIAENPGMPIICVQCFTADGGDLIALARQTIGNMRPDQMAEILGSIGRKFGADF